MEGGDFGSTFLSSALSSGIGSVTQSRQYRLIVENHGGNSTWGSNYKIYWHAKDEQGFYGNQYVNTYRLTEIGKCISNITLLVGLATSCYNLYVGYQLDGGQFQTIGYNTARAAAKEVGSWAGAWAGIKLGGFIGLELGGIPGAAIGAVTLGIGGALGGSCVGDYIVNNIYNW